jgi:predicted nucleic acid-binding protein
MKFWDASALVPLCITEASTTLVRAILSNDPQIAAWWGSPVECWSAFARLRREGIIDLTGEEAAGALLAAYQRSWNEILPGEEIRYRASRLLRLHTLRAQDALQLAAALTWAGRAPGSEAVILDQRLQDAARLEGFAVFP